MKGYYIFQYFMHMKHEGAIVKGNVWFTLPLVVYFMIALWPDTAANDKLNYGIGEFDLNDGVVKVHLDQVDSTRNIYILGHGRMRPAPAMPDSEYAYLYTADPEFVELSRSRTTAWTTEAIVKLPRASGAASHGGGARRGPALREQGGSPLPGSDMRFTEVPAFSFTERKGDRHARGPSGARGSPCCSTLAPPDPARPSPATCGPGCTSACGSDVRLVSFSVDPRFDSPEVLQERAERFQVGDDRWLFLTGELPDRRPCPRRPRWPLHGTTLELGLATHSTRLPWWIRGPDRGLVRGAADGLGRAELEANMDLMTNVASPCPRLLRLAGLLPPASRPSTWGRTGWPRSCSCSATVPSAR